MNEVQALSAKLRTITPVFCAGANQNGPAEIRPFSLRGALRWWYRALDPNFKETEAELFGAVRPRGIASPVALQMDRWVTGDVDLQRTLRPNRAGESGEAYLGYTLYLGDNRRKAVAVDTEVPLRLVLHRGNEPIRRAWAASLWLFGHLGGLGTRARRGFGTLAVERWEGWPECDNLPIAHGAPSPDEWQNRFAEGFRRLRQWYPAASGAPPEHHHLGATVRVRLWKAGYARWDQALSEVGNVFREFRGQQRWHQPELLAAFGLPLRFRNHPAGSTNLRGANRAPSRLQIRVVRIAGRYHPMVWCAEGPLAPANPQLIHRGRYEARVPSDEALQAFLEEIRVKCV